MTTKNAIQVNNALIIDEEGRQCEYSIHNNRVCHEFGRGFAKTTSIATTTDSQTQFECNELSQVNAYDLTTYEKIKNPPIQGACFCVVTSDNEFLITADDKLNSGITKYSLKTFEQVSKWSFEIKKYIRGLKCTNDNKFQFIIYKSPFSGTLGVSDIQKNQHIANITCFPNQIHSLALTKDSLGAYASDWNGNVNFIRWNEDFSNYKSDTFKKYFGKVGKYHTYATCLTKCEKYFIASTDKKLKVFCTRSGKQISQRVMSSHVISISLIRDGSLAIMADEDGNISYFDTKSLKNYTKFKTKDGLAIEKIFMV